MYYIGKSIDRDIGLRIIKVRQIVLIMRFSIVCEVY